MEQHHHHFETLKVRESHLSEQTCLIKLSGELDSYNVKRAADVILGCLSEKESALVIDLSELAYLDSSGIGLLDRLVSRLGFDKVGIWGASDDVYRILEIMGLADKLPFISRPADVNDWKLIDRKAA